MARNRLRQLRWLLLLGLCQPWWVIAQIPDSLVAEGIPEPTSELRKEVARYLEFRAASFLDWHPQRRDMLISTRFAETPQLHRVRTPLGARQQLTFLGERVTAGGYAPGAGDVILFSQDRGGDEFYQLYRLEPVGGRIERVTDGASRNTSVRWAPSGRSVAYASTRRNGRDTDLYVMDPRDPVTDRRVAELSGGGWSVLDWSPDETRLLVSAFVSVNESHLHLLDLKTGELRKLTPASGEKSSYSGGLFLRDGWTALVATDRGSEFLRMVRMDLRTGDVAPFGPDIPWDVEEFDLSGDGRTLAMLVNEDGVSTLRLADAHSGRALRAPKLPAGLASGLRWHPQRRELGLTLSTAKSPSDAYSVDTRVNALTRWTESETGGLNASRFAEPEMVRVTSFDGLKVSGFLYRPDASKFPGPRPVVINIHGGPEGQSRPQFLRSWNYLVQEMGIAVLYPNVRGSEGYGKTFLTLDNGLKREDSVKDIGAFLDWISAQPGLDAGRVAVYGGSYGGYMVLASMAHFGDRLRCGIDVVGISNFLTFLKNTQDYRRDLRRVEYGDERDPAMAAHLLRISPLTLVDRIRKPLMVVQGQNDPRVPVTESEQLVKAIRAQGGTVWYLLGKDEGHGFVRKRNVDFLFLSLVEFLRAHLLN